MLVCEQTFEDLWIDFFLHLVHTFQLIRFWCWFTSEVAELVLKLLQPDCSAKILYNAIKIKSNKKKS